MKAIGGFIIVLVFVTLANAGSIEGIEQEPLLKIKCEGEWIHPGNKETEVWAVCGEPQKKYDSFLYKRYDGRLVPLYPIRIWVYPAGSQGWVYYLSFRDEVLNNITILKEGIQWDKIRSF